MKFQIKIEPGTVLIKEEPFVYILSSKLHSEYCDNCFTKGNLHKCSACQYVYYCNKECQREGWSLHKFECKNIKKVSPKVVPDAARLLARLVRKLQKGGDQVKAYYTEGNFRMFKDLMSHYSDLKLNYKKIEHFTSLYYVLEEFFGGEHLPNTAELLGIFGRMCVNSFNICDSEMIALGTGIYLGSSVIDHSCKPNAVATFEGTTLYVRAIEELPCLDWSQIYISYIDEMATPLQRQQELKETYYFLCKCSKCVKEDWSFMNSAMCPNEKCKSPVNMTDIQVGKKCSKCRTKINEDFIEKFEEVAEFSREQLKNMQSMAYLDVCKFCLQKQEEVFHKHNLQYVKTLDLAFQSSIDFSQWDFAINYGNELIEGYKMYYGNYHPLLGLLYLKLGKLYLYKEKSRDALKYLNFAQEILAITHGMTCKLVRQELLPLMQQAECEATLKRS